MFTRCISSLRVRTLSVLSTVVLPKLEQGLAQSRFSVNVGMNERIVRCRAYKVSAPPCEFPYLPVFPHPWPDYLMS